MSARGLDTASSDPLLLTNIGEITVGSRSVRQMWLRAVALLDAQIASADEDGRFDPAPQEEEEALATAAAKVVADEVGLRLASRAFDVGGAGATTDAVGLDRHWHNIRTLASHNPDVYRLRAIRDLE
ncbi:acyl-CoA dehydrogenase family protein [Gordonia soli]|nr:acyl-CoA dehydrogenase family protein [Gordonia soli]